MKFFKSAAVLIFLVVTLALSFSAAGHGFAGARFFPATLSTDDPFVNDELSLPTVSTIETPEGRETAVAVEIAKRITPNLGIELSEEFLDLNPTHEHEAAALAISRSAQSTSFSRAPSMKRFSLSVQKSKSAEQDSSEWMQRVSVRGHPHFSSAKDWAICRTPSLCCGPLP